MHHMQWPIDESKPGKSYSLSPSDGERTGVPSVALLAKEGGEGVYVS
jgi:hypothetical protein